MTNRILQGDVLARLKDIPDGVVQTCVTSPPYWGLRDYSVEGQLGLEATPELFIEKMVAVFREVRRVLRDDGTLWLNLGDSYAGNNSRASDGGRAGFGNPREGVFDRSGDGLKPKDLCGIPWRVALALQTDGWWLRSDIIWSKPNPMPESCTDRPTKSHEYVFLLTKRANYYYDADAIREKGNEKPHAPGWSTSMHDRNDRQTDNEANQRAWGEQGGRNARSVWNIATQPYPEAHFATFPEELARRCILAGSAEQACGVCGAPWERVSEKKLIPTRGKVGEHKGEGRADKMDAGSSWDHSGGVYGRYDVKTLGFRPTCECSNLKPLTPNAVKGKELCEYVLAKEQSGRCIVLDPFMGSGTVALVALKGRRDFLGIELNPDYIKMAMKRLEPLLKQGSLL